MKKRLGERRAKPRFDIVGLLVGTVDCWLRYQVHNVGPCGALVKTTWPFPLGTRLGGSVSVNGVRTPVRAVVRRAASGRDVDGEPWCWVGLEWVDGPLALDVFDELANDARAAPEGMERRQAPRYVVAGRSEVEFGVSLSVTIADVSGGGVLFSSPMPLDTGVRGYLRMRLAGEDFQSAFEVRRSGEPADAKGGWRMGVAFGSMDDRSRRGLDGLLKRQTGTV